MQERRPTSSVKRAHFAFILQPEFPLAALILATDALRIANQNSGKDLFSWQFVSENAADMRASNGMWFTTSCDFDNAKPAAVCLLFEGNLPTQHVSQKLLTYLRTSARFGSVVGGVDTGAYALAQAGLVATDGAPDVVLHWEAAPTFREWFPEAILHDQIFQLNERRAQCSGGVATLDLMLALIARFAGDAMANEVANAMVHTRRDGSAPQRDDRGREVGLMSLTSRLVAKMEQNFDFPLTLAELSTHLEVP